MSLLIDTSKPNAAQLKALLAWSTVRENCGGYLRSAIAELPLPPSMDQRIKEQFRAGVSDYVKQQLQSGNYLTAMLYTGQISYGEFNKRRAELSEKLMAQLGAWLSVLDAQDKANTMQKAAAAQREVNAAVAVLEAAACGSAKGRTAQVLCQ